MDTSVSEEITAIIFRIKEITNEYEGNCYKRKISTI